MNSNNALLWAWAKENDKFEVFIGNLGEQRIGIPEAERAYLAGAAAQYESEVVYHNMKEEFQKLGIVFTDTDSALKEYPELFKQYFAKLVPPTDNKLAALNSAVWSGGTFIYVPKGVKVDIPLQTYFRINNENSGQFERTLIIVDEGASVHYVEGCTAPIYSSNSLHAAIVEIFALDGAYIHYTTILIEIGRASCRERV